MRGHQRRSRETGRSHLVGNRISGDADQPNGLWFTDEGGRPIAACGIPSPPGSIEAAVARLDLPATEWIHPSGERLDPRYVHFNEMRFTDQTQADRRAG